MKWRSARRKKTRKIVRLFAADAHLSARRPQRAESFFSFLAAARRAREVYLLGDIFDLWIGDDDDADPAQAARAALSALSSAGVAIYLQRGNRDFLLGRRFCRMSGCTPIGDMHAVECGGRRFLLAHGDLFCEDAAYLRYRAVVHSAAFAAATSALPLSWRRTIAAKMRAESRKRRRTAALSQKKVSAALHRHKCQTLIHGHLHIADEEKWRENGADFCRRGLPDWEDGTGGWLEMSEDGELTLRRP